MKLLSKIKHDPQRCNNIAWIALLVISVLLVIAVDLLMQALSHERFVLSKETEFIELGNRFINSVDTLSKHSRKFVVNIELDDLEHYWDEVNIKHTRENTLARLRLLSATDNEIRLMAEAKDYSDKIVDIDTKGMHFILAAEEKLQSNSYLKYDQNSLTADEFKLSLEQKINAARELVFNKHYEKIKQKIQVNILKYRKLMKERMTKEAAKANNYTSTILLYVVSLSTLILLIVFSILWFRHVIKKSE